MSEINHIPLITLPTKSLLGHAKNLSGPDHVNFIMRTFESHGKFVALRIPRRKIILIANSKIAHELISKESCLCKGIGYKPLSKLLGKGLVTNEGEAWKTHRDALKNTFSIHGIEPYFSIFKQSTLQKIHRWKNIDDAIDIQNEMRCLTLEIITKCLLDIDLSTSETDLAAAFTTALEMIGEMTQNPIHLPRWIPTNHNRKLNTALRRVNQFISSIVDSSAFKTHTLGKIAAHHNWTKREFIDEILNLVVAGHETTAQSLTWSLLLLERYPNLLQEIRDEWQAILPSTISELGNLRKTKAFVQEVLRLYPAVPVFAREALTPIQLQGYNLPKGTLFLVSPWAIQRSEEEWGHDAKSFNPERWLTKDPDNGVFYSFSRGKRNCIGIHFAQYELMTLIGLITQHGQFNIRNNEKILPKLSVTLRMASAVNGKWQNRECYE